MAILDILEFPDPLLRNTARPVDKVDASVQQLIDDMFETMYAAPGIGLAATQVNVHKRVIVMDISEDGKQPLAFVNPEVRVLEGGTREYTEGCLSVPGFHEPVLRPENIVVTALDRDGNPFELRPDGLLAVSIQHEIDHLNGKLFVDYLSNTEAPAHPQQARKAASPAGLSPGSPPCRRARCASSSPARPNSQKASSAPCLVPPISKTFILRNSRFHQICF